MFPATIELEVSMPLPHETATALDPQAKAVIDLVIKSGRPPYHTLSPKDARQLFRETRPASTPPAPEIGEVKEIRAAGVPALALQVLTYPVTDVAAESASYAEFADGFMLTRDSMRWFIDHYVPGRQDRQDWRGGAGGGRAPPPP